MRISIALPLLLLLLPISADIFDILDISRDSDSRLVQSAYRKAALKLHPDKSSAPDAEEKFKELASAYHAWREGRVPDGSGGPGSGVRRKRVAGGDDYVVYALAGLIRLKRGL
jgi:hypothetical protein